MILEPIAFSARKSHRSSLNGGIPVGDAERARIAAETSLERLRAWVRRALTASSAAEVVRDEAR